MLLAILLSFVAHLVALAFWGGADKSNGFGPALTRLAVVMGKGVATPVASQASDYKLASSDPQSHKKEPRDRSERDPGLLVPSDALTEMPALLEDLDVAYPAVDRPGAGTVLLKLVLSASGRVISVTLIESDLPPEYAEKAISAFANRRFSPGRIGLLAVPTSIEIEVSFDPYGTF